VGQKTTSELCEQYSRIITTMNHTNRNTNDYHPQDIQTVFT